MLRQSGSHKYLPDTWGVQVTGGGMTLTYNSKPGVFYSFNNGSDSNFKIPLAAISKSNY